jgi:protein-tyrosine phosphatase
MAIAQHSPGENIPIATVPNLRDLGGWSAPTGQVRSGLVFRSAEFANLQGEAAEAMLGGGKRTCSRTIC